MYEISASWHGPKLCMYLSPLNVYGAEQNTLGAEDLWHYPIRKFETLFFLIKSCFQILSLVELHDVETHFILLNTMGKHSEMGTE